MESKDNFTVKELLEAVLNEQIEENFYFDIERLLEADFCSVIEEIAELYKISGITGKKLLANIAVMGMTILRLYMDKNI